MTETRKTGLYITLLLALLVPNAFADTLTDVRLQAFDTVPRLQLDGLDGQILNDRGSRRGVLDRMPIADESNTFSEVIGPPGLGGLPPEGFQNNGRVWGEGSHVVPGFDPSGFAVGGTSEAQTCCPVANPISEGWQQPGGSGGFSVGRAETEFCCAGSGPIGAVDSAPIRNDPVPASLILAGLNVTPPVSPNTPSVGAQSGVPPVTTPEPSTVILLGTGLALFAVGMRIRARARY